MVDVVASIGWHVTQYTRRVLRAVDDVDSNSQMIPGLTRGSSSAGPPGRTTV